jgi:hypothetical protein
MKLSNQAMGALMMALQKSLMDQSDITDLLKQFDFKLDHTEQLIVENPPVLRVPEAPAKPTREIIMPREEDF